MNEPQLLSHGHYILLLSVTGVSQEVIDAKAQEVSAQYMSQFRAAGAFTASVLRLQAQREEGSTLNVPLHYAIRYFGPQASVAGLQASLLQAAHQVGATIETLTFEVNDVTGIF